ncbi:hypothetical protein HD806DRAFT_532307 [Xylariaceae sp. AK1471]|nr:hypothetical protein HD806DRAFT_532307 [Xylariaceae sp. AK1471]
MASIEFSVESVLQDLKEHGFYDLEDSAAGEHVLDMQLRKFPWHEPYGVDWMKYVVWNPRIRLVLEKAFETVEKHYIERPLEQPRFCVLAHSWMYTAAPGHYYRFLPHTKFAVGVFIWAKDSEVDYFSSSHTKDLRTLDPPKDPEQPTEPLLEIPGDAVQELSRKRMEFPNGDM